MSRRRLASEAHVSPSTLQCALARGGDLSLDLLLPISNVLNVSVEYLSGADEPPEMTADELQARWDDMPVDDKIRYYLAGLNTYGKLKVLERLEELAELPKYKVE
jgi:transcriptional regulator with XRE-family HTH domain